MFTKRSEAVVFPPDPALKKPADWLPINDDLIQAYRDQVSPEQEELLGGPQGVLYDGRPVFYLVENGELVFFGHTMMMRLPYRNSPFTLLPEALRDEDCPDMAEALFGFTKKESACAGRVFFTDAVCVPGQTDYFHPVIASKVLGKPNPTTFQHYLEQPEPDDKSRLVDYDDAAGLRGTKYYWHKGPISIEKVQEDPEKVNKKPKLYTTIRPVRSGIGFAFKIHFENLTAHELGVLSWVLRTAAREDLRLKVGMAKPLGMGAVRLSAKVHLQEPEQRYTRLFAEDGGWELGELPDEAAEQKRRQAEEDFVQWVLSDHELNPGGVETLEELPRMKELLKLLSWPGPHPDLTRYMEIEHPDPKAKRGKRNEYRDRPVLPKPTGVGGRLRGPVAPKAKPQASESPEPAHRYQPQPIKPAPKKNAPPQPQPEDIDPDAPVSDSAKEFMDWFIKKSKDNKK